MKIRTLAEQLTAVGCATVKEWLDCHPGRAFELWLPNITVTFSPWSATQTKVAFQAARSDKVLRYINPKSALNGYEMILVIKNEDLEKKFAEAEAEANAADKSYAANPARWGNHCPSRGHIIFRSLARKDEVLLNNK